MAPGRDIVAVFTGGFYDRKRFASLLLTAVKSDGPLPENPAGRAQLERSLAEARQAHELLGTGGVIGKIVLMRNGLPSG